MTKAEAKERIYKGECLSDMFEFTDGQDCIIYKGTWNQGDEVIYIPDIDLNEICINRPLVKILDEEEINDALSCLYTGKDFMELADNNEELAKRLFGYVDWQHPSSALEESIVDEIFSEEENEKEKKDGEIEINLYPELEKYDKDHCRFISDSEREEDAEYEVIFEVDKQRYYCYIITTNMIEALGIFFVDHPHITYNMVVDHTEV